MDIVLDIMTGIGLALAAGIRPFVPALAAGAFAAANVTIDFEGRDLSFAESPGWLVAMAVALVLLVVVRRRLGGEPLDAGPGGMATAAIAAAIGALLFAAALSDHSDTWWPGLIGGVLLALLAARAIRDLLGRTRARLDAETRDALDVYAEGAALLLAVLSILAPPLSLAALGFVVWLIVGGRRRQGEKYAGLRILR